MANEQMREYWKVGAEGWVRLRQLFDAELGPFADGVVAVAAPGPGDRVLDVGCGTGALLGMAVDRGASGVGVDVSPPMIEEAAVQVPGATFVVADAQTEDLTALGPFTTIVSRFGVMFFDDPAAAFANIRRAAAPGAQLAFVCWRGVEENPMFTLGTSVLVDRLDPKPPPPAPGIPGPMAFADPVRVEGFLSEAGWAQIDVAPLDATVDYGSDGSDGVENRVMMILNTAAGRSAREQLEPRLGTEEWNALLDDVRAELRRHLVDGRVSFTGATWLVTARNPG